MEKRINLIRAGARYLKGEGILNPVRETEIFLSDILHCPRVELYLNNSEVAQSDYQHYWQCLYIRKKGFPLQYILGDTEFMNLKFKIAPNVFIPRPETEILIESILQLVKYPFNLSKKVLDIGTGCGNIAISLAKYLHNSRIFACDVSDCALKLAKENSDLNNVSVGFIKSDLFSAFKKRNIFTLIVSNPPYIKTRDIANLPREVQYEPPLALDGGLDGLAFYSRIIKSAADYLQNKGFLVLEIGDNQTKAIKNIFTEMGRFSKITIIKDLTGAERVILAQKGQ